MDTEKSRLTHLRTLEAESIHILREAVAEFENPVMLYSIGKDSSVMLRLAEKAFAPAPLPFSLMHIDTTWKFREMIAHRDRMAKEVGADLIVMGTHGRRGVSRALLGSITEAVIRTAPCPVLAVRANTTSYSHEHAA